MKTKSIEKINEKCINEPPTRRERIATTCLLGLLASPDTMGSFEAYAKDAVNLADALIAELDNPKV